ncbi:helix-turn-helix transcriptional regulator [Dyadobacter sp. CY347]|uniref:helix-turn-helix transcriptional regulator n=1 Tax=Dyadobacter sp. CY347 TaxID=2909336 RepID=UPI001F323C87|nr:helix-turn-helix transcriptional regulator [Dyadobacter sp. CY347]MCF2489918.1 helix-turn-helix transcriptional regulator [Dyadobacter sp. CY347]
MSTFSSFLKERRKAVGLTQEELAFKAGVGLRFVRDLEQGKKTLRLDKVNQVLWLFGKEVGVVDLKQELKKEKDK